MLRYLHARSHAYSRAPRKEAAEPRWLGGVPALLLLLIGLILLGWPQPAAALSDTPNPNTWITDGQVNAIVSDGTTLTLEGTFPL